MSDWFLETGLYLLGVVLIPGVGLLLVCWGLWGDRSKGRLRCPKCWYDMRGTLPRMECPACGYDAGHVRRLCRSRRRWRPIVVGIVLLLLSSYPLAVVGGWCREQSVGRYLTRRGHTVERQVRIGPTWLVARLPEGFARIFGRVSTARFRRGGNEDVAECVKLSELRHLRLHGVRVKDAGLMHLTGLSKLQQLDLYGTQVTDVGLVHLKGLPTLARLILPRTQVTDAGLVHLKGLPRLERLNLFGTQVTDAGLVHLEGLSNLRRLELTSTQVTDAGVAKLEQALPNVEVVRVAPPPRRRRPASP